MGINTDNNAGAAKWSTDSSGASVATQRTGKVAAGSIPPDSKLPDYLKNADTTWQDIWGDQKIRLPSPKTIDSYANSADILRDGKSIFNVVRNVMIALYKLNSTLKRAERQDRTDLIKDVADLQRQEAQKIREAADLNLAAGIVGGAFQVVGGVMSLGMSAASPKASAVEVAEPIAESPTGEPTPETAPEELENLEGEGPRESLLESETESSLLESGGKVKSKPAAAQEINALEDAVEGGGEGPPAEGDVETEGRISARARVEDETQQNIKLREQKIMKAKNADAKAFVEGQKYQLLSLRVQAMTQLTGGAGQAITSGLQYGAQQMNAVQKEIEAKTDMYKAYQSNVDGFIKDASDALSGMLSKLDSIQQSVDDATLKIVER